MEEDAYKKIEDAYKIPVDSITQNILDHLENDLWLFAEIVVREFPELEIYFYLRGNFAGKIGILRITEQEEAVGSGLSDFFYVAYLCGDDVCFARLGEEQDIDPYFVSSSRTMIGAYVERQKLKFAARREGDKLDHPVRPDFGI